MLQSGATMSRWVDVPSWGELMGNPWPPQQTPRMVWIQQLLEPMSSQGRDGAHSCAFVPKRDQETQTGWMDAPK